MYPLKKISVTNGVKTWNMISKDTFDLSTVILKGSNKNDVEYYGFDQNKGHWILTDQNGKELTGSNIASLTEEKANGEAILTAGDEEGTLYLKYMIDDDTTYTSLENEKPATLESFIFKDKGTPDIIDLSKLTVKAFDQYDGEWNDLSDVKWHIDFTGEKAEDSFSDYLLVNKLPIDKAGTCTGYPSVREERCRKYIEKRRECLCR